MNYKKINIDNINLESDKLSKKRKNNFLKKILIWIEFNVWNYITYYCWRNPKRIIYNFWYFRKEIYNFRAFDYQYNFDLFIKSLERTASNIDNNEIIVEHKEVSDSIRSFCILYKRITDDNYMEEVGYDYTQEEIYFDPIKNSSLFELKKKTKYSDEEFKKFLEEAEILRKKDFNLLVEEFKKFQTWWD